MTCTFVALLAACQSPPGNVSNKGAVDDAGIVAIAWKAVTMKYPEARGMVLLRATHVLESFSGQNGYSVKFSASRNYPEANPLINDGKNARITTDIITVLLSEDGEIRSITKNDVQMISFQLRAAKPSFELGTRKPDGTITPTLVVPWAVDGAYGWDVRIPARPEPVVLKEIFKLPAPARFLQEARKQPDPLVVSTAKNVIEEGQVLVTETVLDATQTLIFPRTYRILDDDPRGLHRIEIHLNGELFAEREFEIR